MKNAKNNKDKNRATLDEAMEWIVFRRAVCMILLCGAFITSGYFHFNGGKNTGEYVQKMTVVAGEPIPQKKTTPKVDVINALVGRDNPLDPDYMPKNLVLVGYTEERLEKEAAGKLQEMMTAMEKEDLHIDLVSGYQSYGRQKTLFERKVNEIWLDNPRLSKEEVEIIAAESVDLPGTSEHQTGYAVDIAINGIRALDMKDTPEGQWLADNAHLYGFIERYPEDKSEITGVGYQPWHLRYVGLELAERIYETGLCLEELL